MIVKLTLLDKRGEVIGNANNHVPDEFWLGGMVYRPPVAGFQTYVSKVLDSSCKITHHGREVDWFSIQSADNVVPMEWGWLMSCGPNTWAMEKVDDLDDDNFHGVLEKEYEFNKA